jgi:hypothetical protein
LFLPSSFAPPQNTTTSLLDKLLILVFTEFTSTLVQVPGFTTPWTSKLSFILDLTLAAQFLIWLSPGDIIGDSHIKPIIISTFVVLFALRFTIGPSDWWFIITVTGFFGSYGIQFITLTYGHFVAKVLTNILLTLVPCTAHNW